MSYLKILLAVLSLSISTSLISQTRTNPQDQDKELGKVAWLRDYDAALALAKKESKPVLILFQEVPGCATCRNYGHNVLSHPLMTEAIQNEFIPLAIFNNKRGKDKEILKKYNEPSWNNPVVRIVNADGKDLVTRIARDYSARGLLNGMLRALEVCGIPAPEYMKLLKTELGATQRKEAYYKMYCFWTGEKELGSQAGVVNTNAGFMSGHEVVRVEYDPAQLSEKQLTEFAQRRSMYPIDKDVSYYHSEKDEDYYLRRSRYKYLPLSKLQRTKINSALGNGQDASVYLSPQQRRWLTTTSLKNNKVLFDKDLLLAWQGKLGQ